MQMTHDTASCPTRGGRWWRQHLCSGRNLIMCGRFVRQLERLTASLTAGEMSTNKVYRRFRQWCDNSFSLIFFCFSCPFTQSDSSRVFAFNFCFDDVSTVFIHSVSVFFRRTQPTYAYFIQQRKTGPQLCEWWVQLKNPLTFRTRQLWPVWSVVIIRFRSWIARKFPF